VGGGVVVVVVEVGGVVVVVVEVGGVVVDVVGGVVVVVVVVPPDDDVGVVPGALVVGVVEGGGSLIGVDVRMGPLVRSRLPGRVVGWRVGFADPFLGVDVTSCCFLAKVVDVVVEVLGAVVVDVVGEVVVVVVGAAAAIDGLPAPCVPREPRGSGTR
jgi:hypothetical protein